METLSRNSTSYPVKLSARLLELFAEYRRLRADEDVPKSSVARALKYYQFLVRAVMTDPAFGMGVDSRGLLVYHTMGMGKTFLAVATAMAMWDVRPPIVLAAKALQKNFSATVRKFVAITRPGAADLKAEQDAAVARFQFVTLDAHNMAAQMARATTGVEGEGSLRGRLLIVDEAHNLFRAIINSPLETSNARRLYNMIMASRDVRILFLTGTPASKDPFELVPCFNMLAGYDLLPTQYEVFVQSYVDAERGQVRNAAKLSNRLLGLVSHVSHMRPSEPAADADDAASALEFPEELPIRIEEVPMSRRQYEEYLRAREDEETRSVSAPGRGPSAMSMPARAPNLALPGTGAGGGQTYYVKSRSISNFAPPRNYTGGIEGLPDSAFDEEASPKMTRLVENLGVSPGPALVYSQFVETGGLGAGARYLDLAGYKPLGAPSAGDAPRYAVISGKVKPEDRERIQTILNSPGNAHGEKIMVLLVSKTGAEGLDLKGIRQIHVLEPYWDKAREDQVRYRGVRLGSHAHLPPEERVVQPFLYISTRNPEVYEELEQARAEAEKQAGRGSAVGELHREPTIDEKFHRRASARKQLNESFRDVLRSVAIECVPNGYGGCRQCAPTGARLFDLDPERDLTLPDPCLEIDEKEAEAREMEYDGRTYFFREVPAAPAGYEFYVHDAELDAYTPLSHADPLYHTLSQAVPTLA